jgi:hypothetical protein
VSDSDEDSVVFVLEAQITVYQMRQKHQVLLR